VQTKDKILITSRLYFNQHGYGSPTLYEISKKVGISRGNLTYYYKTKEELLEALVQQMWEEYKAGQLSATQFPSWTIIKKSIGVLQDLIFFQPSVQEILQKIESDSIKTQMSMFAFSIQIGNMNPEPATGIYHNICKAIWMSAFYWHVSQTYNQQRAGNWDDIMWSLLYPHFTEKGRAAFVKRFGKDYANSLGISLENFQKGVVDF